MPVTHSSPVRVGLIGCGRIAQAVHLRALLALPGVDIVALAELDPQRRQEAVRYAPRTRAFADYADLLALPDVEAVVICLPSGLHAEAAIAALEQRKHIYLEKPLAGSTADGRRVLAAWRNAGVVGMHGFNLRFNPLYEAMRQRLAADMLGELVSAHSVFSTAVRPRPAWQQHRATGGGALLDLACHHIDLVRYWFKPAVREVWASLQSQRIEDDTVALGLRLADGMLIQSFFSMSAVDEDRFEVYGQAGKLSVDRFMSLDVTFSDARRRHARLRQLAQGWRFLVRTPYMFRKLREPIGEPSYRVALSRFVAGVRTGQPVSPDLWDGYHALTVIEAAEESARTGRVVTLNPLNATDDPFERHTGLGSDAALPLPGRK